MVEKRPREALPPWFEAALERASGVRYTQSGGGGSDDVAKATFPWSALLPLTELCGAAPLPPCDQPLYHLVVSSSSDPFSVGGDELDARLNGAPSLYGANLPDVLDYAPNTQVPEPATLGLLALGLAGVGPRVSPRTHPAHLRCRTTIA